MNRAEGKAWLRHYYGTKEKYEETVNANIAISELLDLLSLISSIACGSSTDKQAREFFLFDACTRLDRWRCPTPFVVTLEHRTDFRKCAMMFSEYESRHPMNSPIFVLHAFRDELYEKFSGIPLPLNSEELMTLDELWGRIVELQRPLSPTKRTEFDSEFIVISGIVDGLRDGTLRTVLSTSLPYAISAQPIDLKTKHREIELTGSLIPHFQNPSGTFVSGGGATIMAEMNTTRWPGGTTSVELRFSALVDPSVEAPALRIPSGGGIPRDTWPNGFNVAFDVIYGVCWHLRSLQSESFGWIPSPSDIGQLHSRMTCSSNDNFGWILRNNPASLMKAFAPASEPLVMEGELQPIPWHRKCRELAQQHARVGDMREAVFWLNVGVESLINERMRAAVARAGSPIDLDSLDGKDAYWDEARQLVSAVSKGVAEQINWPDNKQKPSRFRQIKYVCKKIEGAPPFAEVQSNYAKVSKERNALFHGENDSSVSVETVVEATAGYDWLDLHFFPQS